MKQILSLILISLIPVLLSARNAEVVSPNTKIRIELLNTNNDKTGEWYLKVYFENNKQTSEIIPKIELGISRSDQDFHKNLKLLKISRPKQIEEDYITKHGKRSHRNNSANEVVVSFENPDKTRLNLIIRAYNDGMAFRYQFPENEGNFAIKDELTSYIIPDSTERWLQKFDLSNEKLFDHMNSSDIQGNWGYPALFHSPDRSCWYLVHEADLDRNYCATKLSNLKDKKSYKVTLPAPHEGEGEALPKISLPWESPWRVIIMGELSDIVESTLVEDVSTASVIEDTDWIKPGLVSWNYWSDNHGTRDYQTVKKFTDLAARMDWPYTLFDWEWDAMGNGGDVEDAAKYAISKGIKPLIWYNSGMFKWITATPIDRMKTHENRMEEFAWLKGLGFAGVKVDFFLSEKQYMINYYLDILKDAAKFEMMVNFHGSLVPRGWARTYPHLMTMEAVRGAEWYNNNPELTTTAPKHNTILPFTRNVVGSMDYTPVTFTNSQHPHITSYGHELALGVVFESAFQHMADRPDGYDNLPDAAKLFLRELPAAWDDTKLIDGYPGKDVIIARRKGAGWYLGGINAEAHQNKNKTLNFNFLPEGQKYKLTLITDGEYDTELSTSYLVVDKNSEIDVKMLRRGGFAASLKPVQ
ncbi:glycoside hydrolase family 97 protein [Thermophagus xiamenensis]|uniref:Glycosyl-hydrolase 97 C-terminal, oligomerisation n=1 Tax=Thermophagus xiamenensis TaxID=385682 RepID=A0A1I1VZM2_9BACT|nr:glycoside hydrolase family 97 protein [Thermophagus xiamenensis]SFD88265.1 Glycosyl-hydrolase 97 C-terminal, oligomerisation [Thermophagus xiamenensis]